MATIVVNPQQSDEDVATETIVLNVIVSREDWFGLYNRLQVFRSTDGPNGPFEELTAASWSPARLPKTGGDRPTSPVTGANVNIVGDTLEMITDGDDLVITFTGSDPLTLATVASQITAQSLDSLDAYVDSSGQLVIETTQVGTGASLEITGGDAVSALNLPLEEPESVSYGRDPRVALTDGVTSYTVTDLIGSRDYYYKTRFINSFTGATSDFSVAINGKNVVEVTTSNLIEGVAELIGMDGKPMVGAEVRVYNEFNGTLVDGKAVTSKTIVHTTNSAGQVVFTLLRGQRVTVSVAGTTLYRTITVPTDPSRTEFNLFEPDIADDDVFTVNVPNLISAERRS